MRKEWEDAHSVTEELVEGPPSRRANATLTACPSGQYLWSIGGEFFSDDKKAYFYNDVFRYNPEKDEWRKYVSKVCPGPRSAHAIATSPSAGGKLWLFGGEFSSLHQNTFHHYRDFWCFDITSRTWERLDTKERPSARSGHRMASWKHYIVLYGGFYDPGITTRYLSDLWVFDTQAYKWREIKFGVNEQRPSARSGFSFLSTPDGIVLHGGYCKEYAKGKRPVGVMLNDTWFLNMTIQTPAEGASTKNFEPLKVKWEKKKQASTSYAPAARSGATMTLWANRGMGVQFGGVTDEDVNEESMKSVFWNDLNGYIWTAKGRWVSLVLKRPKKAKQGKKQKKVVQQQQRRGDEHEDQDDEENEHVAAPIAEEVDLDDPSLTVPIPRYNAMLAVLKNTLYIYGGIFERGSREYTLDDFYSLDLDKLDRYACLKPSGIVIDENDESSEDEDDDDDDDEDEDEDDNMDDDIEMDDQAPVDQGYTGSDEDEAVEGEAEEAVDDPSSLRTQATQFMGVARDNTRSAEDIVSTPLPGETLAMFYARSREHWAQVAHTKRGNDSRGKELRRDGFALASERYAEYKPLLKEVEKILAEAGLDEDEMRRSAAAGPSGATQQSRNRR
ncbi:galactose oxidase [Cylindrobasidium torrendii FP15055 ss-10]|uniref:Galactose oxidase n=1 Tax=Cylindrobasidium torrendii FP15055 ss-10 TaxID=1314674 RepID=A0A0D7BUH0_9AGAR|nr:galactose oxidase [Cylindrobasidium torrendii FP15055 ss-10]